MRTGVTASGHGATYATSNIIERGLLARPDDVCRGSVCGMTSTARLTIGVASVAQGQRRPPNVQSWILTSL
jgi:hypothetical protein